MLIHPNDKKIPVWRGLLIDFDYAALVEAVGKWVILAGFQPVHIIGILF